MKEKISRNKISGHYKSFFGLENMGLGENDNLMIDWGESLVNDFCNQEVDKRIADRIKQELILYEIYNMDVQFAEELVDEYIKSEYYRNRMKGETK